jgi:hypothetical protein
MKILELFAGSRSIGKVAEEMGHDVFSVDKFITNDMDLVCGVEDLTKEIILSWGTPDIIHGSPVCSAWSKTGWFHHWDTEHYRNTKQFKPKTDFANESVEMIRKTIEIFSWFPDAVYFMENPEGMLYRHPVINTFTRYNIEMDRLKVTYCQYGDSIMKPTHLWTNCKSFKPRKCNAGDPCHASAPKGSWKGMYEKGRNYERSVIPDQLCREMLEAAVKLKLAA